MRILVIDDDGLAGAMTSFVLEELGHVTVQSESAAEALSTLALDPGIQMIISDLHMPDTSGLELFRQLRDRAIKLPFILLSGADPDQMHALEPELDACVLKDETLETSLARAIAQILARPTL